MGDKGKKDKDKDRKQKITKQEQNHEKLSWTPYPVDQGFRKT